MLSPGAGIISGQNAAFTYKASGVPSGGRIFLQKASLSGTTVHWSNVNQLNVRALGSATILRPPAGIDTYRVGIFDARGSGLASAPLNLNVYKPYTLSDLTTRPLQTLAYGQGQANSFQYVFQSEILIENTSCRLLGPLQIFNAGFTAQRFQFSETVHGKTSSTIFPIAANNFQAHGPETLFSGGRLLTLGETVDLKVLDDANGNSTLYGGNSGALCLTDTGSF